MRLRNPMKFPIAFILVTFLILNLIPAVEAYGLYGPFSFYGYKESTDFYRNTDSQENSNSYLGDQSYLSNFDSSSFSDFQQNQFGSNTEGFANTYVQDFLRDADISYNEGYQGHKKPCATYTGELKGNFHGKDNDFTITKTEKSCNGIELDFFKDNSYNDQLINNVNTNYNNFGASTYQNSLNNKNTQSNTLDTTQKYQQSYNIFSQGITTNFGKGTRIILN